MNTPHSIRKGKRFPSGATWSPDGTNFSLFSRIATAVELRLYARAADDEPCQVIPLDARANRVFFSWCINVEGVPPGMRYDWRVRHPDGTWHVVLDPWARAIDDSRWSRRAAIAGGPPGLRGIVAAPPPPGEAMEHQPRALEGAVIYEMHVGGFTRHPSSGVSQPGTFDAVIEKIPYLKELGVTHVELLPVMAFDEQDVPDGVADRGLHNYWGYSPYGFYAPHPGFCATDDAPGEFRRMVRALHDAGIGVLLDVVFNHTSEGGPGGPVIHFKALASEMFYHRDHADPRRFRDYTGCGNTINCNHPLVTRFLVHCLEYWARDMGVDGFRFDLASVFARGEDGAPMANPPLPWSIELSHTLIETPIIAEAWDAGGLYQVGSFPGMRWAEWNGHYRDVMRRFLRGDAGLLGDVAACLAGSSHLYADDARPPSCSINFITCHDGFTLWDLVSHNQKHNTANGEDNRDGCNDNMSWNCGVEGETTEPGILEFRCRQARNALALLFLSQGVPMLLAGDEVLRGQRGNNNAWCQDNEISWQAWKHGERESGMAAFTKGLIAFRRRHACFRWQNHLTGQPQGTRGLPDISWNGPDGAPPDWSFPWARFLAFTLGGRDDNEEDVHVITNMSEQEIRARLPEIPGRVWHAAIDTSAALHGRVFEPGEQPRVESASVAVPPRCILAFESRPVAG